MEADHPVFEYDVFLSFRGPDTRQGFTDVLFDTMVKAGIRVFRDDDELAVGDEIGKILKALKNSQICVPIFSKRFAQSRWCLLEVRRMAKLGKELMPIFYEVTPDDVRLKTPMYTGFMQQHREVNKKKRVDKWENALKAATRIKGMPVLDKRYTDFCKEFVEQALKKLGPREKFDVGDAIGLEDPVESVLGLLAMKPVDVMYLGIYGMGGIGKTTLAKVIYNRCSAGFDCRSFIEDVRGSSERHGLDKLEKELQKSLDRYSKRGHSFPLKESFRTKKVFIVLDDVNMPEQVETLAGRPDWFGHGSRIIVTSRDADILAKCRTLHTEDISNYRMPMLGNDHALQLFSRCAFKKDSPPVDFERLSKEAISTCGGLPLALIVIGRLLVNKEKDVWESVIAKSKKIPGKEVKERLKISYDTLDTDQKQIFLDIACFRVYMDDKIKACYMWEGCGFYPICELAVLQTMCLIQIKDNNRIWMHDQLRDLGKDIVRDESDHKRKRSRVWEHDEALEVIMSKKRKTNVQGLCLNKPCKVELTETELASFDNLRFLQLDDVEFRGNLDGLLQELRWLSFKSCSAFGANNFTLPNLVTLDASESSVSENWGGWSFLQSASKLKELNLTRCLELERTPQFLENMIIERLILEGCKSLVTVDRSIGNLNDLIHLNLRYCKRIRRLPKEISSLVKLVTLSVSGCHQLNKFPHSSIGKLNLLVELDLGDTRIAKLPDPIGELKQLKRLNLAYSKVAELPQSIGALKSLIYFDLQGIEIAELPSSIGGLMKLEELNIGECRELKTLPDSIGELKSLIRLDLAVSEGISELPLSLGGLAKLEDLNLSMCTSLEALPHSVGELKSLTSLNISGTRITELPDSIGGLQKLERILIDAEVASLYRKRVSSSIIKLPSRICHMPLLKELSLANCDHLRELPELPTTLTRLSIKSEALQILELHSLPNLINLKHLQLLAIFNSPSTDFSRFSQLGFLELDCRNLSYPLQFPSTITTLRLDNVNSGTKLNCLSNLKCLFHLSISNWSDKAGFESLSLEELYSLRKVNLERCGEGLIRAFCRLMRLRNLYIKGCELRNSPLLDLSCLKNLELLHLLGCQGLVKINGFGSMERLRELCIADCNSLKRLEDMSELNELRELRLFRCESIARSLGNMKCLRRLIISDCNSLKGLKNMSKLEELYVYRCEKITRIDRLGDMDCLCNVAIIGCKSLKGLDNMSKLIELQALHGIHNETMCESCEAYKFFQNIDEMNRPVFFGGRIEDLAYSWHRS